MAHQSLRGVYVGDVNYLPWSSRSTGPSLWPTLHTNSIIIVFVRESLETQLLTLATGEEHLGTLGWHICPTERHGTTKHAAILASLSDDEQKVFAGCGLDLPSANNLFCYVMGHCFRSDIVVPIKRR